MLDCCNLCPRNCKVNRFRRTGYCGCNDKIKVALVSTHYFEEPCISGTNGSGTIFFSNCNMNCIYCQNYEISHEGKGVEITTERLAEIFLEQQYRGVNNINLVTPTMYVYQIIDAIKIAKSNGLNIPIVYNTNGYENVDTIKLLNGYIDVFLPDLKYFSNDLAIKYSNAPDYFNVSTKAIIEMYKQVGDAIFENEKIDETDNKIRINECTKSETVENKYVKIMKRGLIIRHLILPNHIQNSKHILKWIKNNMPENTYVSIMAQYFPTYKAKNDNLLNRKINKSEYKEIENYLYTLDLKNGYMQDLGKHEEEYVPEFNYKNVIKM